MKIRIIYILYIVCLLYTLTFGCKIAFRLDEVQDYTNSAAQIALINYFDKANIPITLGVIANKFGLDLNILSLVQDGLTKGKVNIGSNGWNYELFTNYSLNDQITLLRQSRSKIQTTLPGISIDTFIAPFDIANNITFLAVQEANYKILTANPTDFSCPILIAGSKPSYALPDSGGVEKADVQIQLSQCDFSIIHLQPINYALPGNQVDNTSMSNLDILFQQLNTLNCTYQFLQNLIPSSPTSITNTISTTSSFTTSPTSIVTTISPTSSFTTTSPTSIVTTAPTSSFTTSIVSTNSATIGTINGSNTSSSCENVLIKMIYINLMIIMLIMI